MFAFFFAMTLSTADLPAKSPSRQMMVQEGSKGIKLGMSRQAVVQLHGAPRGEDEMLGAALWVFSHKSFVIVTFDSNNRVRSISWRDSLGNGGHLGPER